MIIENKTASVKFVRTNSGNDLMLVPGKNHLEAAQAAQWEVGKKFKSIQGKLERGELVEIKPKTKAKKD